jgi:MFS-type transporter involved in bile tolerance (Atg22 family)
VLLLNHHVRKKRNDISNFFYDLSYLDSYIALITLAIESSKDGKMTLNG